MIYDRLLEKTCVGLIVLGGCRTGAPVLGVEAGQNHVEYSTKSTDLNLNNAARQNGSTERIQTAYVCVIGPCACGTL